MILYILILLLVYFALHGFLGRSIVDIVAAVVTLVLILIQQGVLK